jgi:hypothetical protein
MHSTHARHAHPRTAHQHVQHCTALAHHTSVQEKRAKEHNLFKVSFFGAGVVISAKHISSAPKGESRSTVELQIGGVAAPELVWWSWIPPKHGVHNVPNFVVKKIAFIIFLTRNRQESMI